MPPRFDADNRRLELSVADLIETAHARHLGFAQRGGYERLWVGQAIHSRYQEAAIEEDPTYRREVAVDHTLIHRGWEVKIRGRIDGLRRDEDGGLVVEEIKSVRRGRRGSRLPPPTRELYERQVLLYGWLLEAGGEDSVRCELVLIEIGSGATGREPIEGDFQDIGRAVRRRLNHLIRSFETERVESDRRREAAAELVFPHGEIRAGQSDIIERVGLALEQREHLLVEAPTGIGKTVAALYPALRYALENDKRLFVLTAKTLQQDMAMAVLQAMNRDDAYHSLRLRAKGRMCANDEIICHEEFCPYAKSYYLKLHQSGVLARLMAETGTLEPEAIFEASSAAEVCPFEVSLELSGKSQVVVCDYNYVFDPYVSLHEFGGEEDLEDVVLVIDEIHNLVGRGRGYYSPALLALDASAAAESFTRSEMNQAGAIAALCRSLAERIEQIAHEAVAPQAGKGNRSGAAEVVLPVDEFLALRPDFDAAFVDYIDFQRETSSYRSEDPFVSFYFDFLRFLDGLYLSDDQAFSHCAELGGGGPDAAGPALRVLCKDPSRFVGRTLNRTHSAIGLSATLSPPDFYRDLLGFDRERTATLRLPSPFPSENRRIVIDSSVATTYREREANYQPIARRLGAMAESVPGNCLALFPSYGFLRRIEREIEVKGKHVLVQNRSDSHEVRQKILEALRSPFAGDVLLLAVAGGVFAEGVDYPGEMLKAVAVVGPCLPALTLEQELLKLHYQEHFERGFEYAFVVPGMTRVVQAAGRLIRSADDTGVIALFDRRFLQPPYREHIPDDWHGGTGPEELIGEPERAAREFFEGLAEGLD